MPNILIAVDDDYYGNLMADFAAQNFSKPETDFRVITVIPWLPPESQVRQYKDLQNFVEATKASRKDLLDNFAEQLQTRMPNLTGHKLELVSAEGNAAEEILKAAESWPADLILVGSHSRKGLNLFIMGSISSAVVNHAPCSVLVVRPRPADAQAYSEKAQSSLQSV